MIPSSPIPIVYSHQRPQYISRIKFGLRYTIQSTSRVVPIGIPASYSYPKISDFINISRYDSVELYEFDSMFVSYHCTFGRSNVLYKSTDGCQILFPNRPESMSVSNFVGSFQTVLGICMTGTYIYGHFIIDTIEYFMILPERLITTASIIVPERRKFVDDILPLFGIRPEQKISVPFGSFLFARRFYTFDPPPWLTKSPFMGAKLRKFFVDRFALDMEKPWRGILYNRAPWEQRTFPNFEEICEDIESSFKEIKWERINRTVYIVEAAKLFNEAKILLSIHGSQMTNLIFMQPGTCVCEVEIESVNSDFMCLAYTLGINYVFSLDTSQEFFFPMVFNISTNLTHKLVDRAIKLISN